MTLSFTIVFEISELTLITFHLECRYCKNGSQASQLEHLVHCDGIWLHAFRYSGSGWSFTAPIPEWAKDFNVNL